MGTVVGFPIERAKQKQNSNKITGMRCVFGRSMLRLMQLGAAPSQNEGPRGGRSLQNSLQGGARENPQMRRTRPIWSLCTQ